MANNTLGKVYLHEAQGTITDLLEKLGGDEGQEWLAATKRFLRREDAWRLSVEAFTLEVNYDQSVEEVLEAGNCDWKDEDLTSEHFPSTRSGVATIEAYLVHFRRQMTLDEIFAEFDERGLRPASVEELLAFGARYLYPQTQFSVTALGWPVMDRVLTLRHDSRGFAADLERGGTGRCASSRRFLAVKK